MDNEPGIFISYRHGDGSGFAMQLYDDLANHFGAEHVFRDIRSIGPGEDFVEVFTREVDSCKVFLAVIGRNWLLSAEKKRSEKETDYVQLEIGTALKRRDQNKESITIIPVLVDGASMPRERDLPEDIRRLAALKAYPLFEELWDEGLQKLVKHLETEISAQTEAWRVPSRYSIILGTLLGLITSAIIAINAQEYEGIRSLRFVVALMAGLIVGLSSSASINLGLAFFMRKFKGAWYAKILGGGLGGSVGGLIAIIVAGLPYFWTVKEGERTPQLNAMGGGNAVDPIQIVIAVVVATCGIALGILTPKRMGEWSKAFLSLLIVIGVDVAIMFVAIRFIALNVDVPEKQVSLDSPFAVGIMTFGLLCGFLAGLQVVAMLMIYDRLNKSANRQPVHVAEGTR